jgi:hypothetical protein
VLGGFVGGVHGMFIGLTISPPLGYLLSFEYIKRRYGGENYPLFLADLEREKKAAWFECKRQIVRRTTKKDAPHQVRRGLWH